MLLLGGATTGIWLASTGLVHLERRFVLAISGSCSFCGNDRAETKTLVGTIGRPAKICNECIALSCDILAEEMERDPVPVRESQPSSNALSEDRLAEILRRVATERDLGYTDALLDDLRRFFEPDRAKVEVFKCSFCDTDRQDVAKLINGPGVSICDACVGDATAIVAHVLRA
jgi:ClpX C4-type zinc finger protein